MFNYGETAVDVDVDLLIPAVLTGPDGSVVLVVADSSLTWPSNPAGETHIVVRATVAAGVDLNGTLVWNHVEGYGPFTGEAWVRTAAGGTELGRITLAYDPH